jgi:hypothetical protein
MGNLTEISPVYNGFSRVVVFFTIGSVPVAKIRFLQRPGERTFVS